MLSPAEYDERFLHLFSDGTLQQVGDLINSVSPAFDINRRVNSAGLTGLSAACVGGRADVVSMLLKVPGVEVNSASRFGWTPLHICCFYEERLECLRILLADPRVSTDVLTGDGCTALWNAAYYGRTDVIKIMIASGREIDWDFRARDFNESPLMTAEHNGKMEAAALLRRYRADPQRTRQELRLELGYREALAADLFALVVFLCDDFLAVATSATCNSVVPFFRMTTRLPMELQMMVCCRAFGSLQPHILSSLCEASFRALTSLFLN